MTANSHNKKNDEPRVSVIIVNYHSMELIDNLITSIYKHSSHHQFEIIVVSNSEWGDHGKILFDKYPDIHWVNHGKNLGFSAANNIGARRAKGQYLFFLNPDTLFTTDVIGELLLAKSKYPDAGIIGPYTLNADMTHQPSVKNEFGLNHMLILAFPFLKLFFPQNKFGHISITNTQFVDVINGSALFLERNLFLKVGGMNEDYFMYWEENDLCRSVKNAGKKILFYKEAQIIHFGGETTQKVFVPMEIEKHRSQKQFLVKFDPRYVRLNRVLGAVAYLWRFIGSLLLFNKKKVTQFGSIFLWYIFKYE
ncbi:MAG TPA: glycosyltransferase family 2 protein [Balneolales bacterium]|nr:glycosyltransferase family 2 protein [Balneolales bacterium]